VRDIDTSGGVDFPPVWRRPGMSATGTRTVAAPAVRARWAVAAVFAANGGTIAGMVVRTPSLKLEHGLTDARLGLLSAVFGVSAVAAMQVTGRLAARVGSAAVIRVVAVALPVAVVGQGVAPGFGWLAATMLVAGVLHGTLDVTMNAHAVAVERALGRPVMNGCHAAWSIGAVTGAGAGGAAAGAGASLTRHLAVQAAVFSAAALVAGRGLLPRAVDRLTAAAGGDRRGRWTPRLLLLGAMGATVLTCEVAVANWSGVLLHDHRGASLGVASLGYVAFTACQTAGRLVGDRVQARRPAPVLVRAGTAVGAAGLSVALLSPWTAVSVVGFAVLGIGLATPLPVLFGVVGHLGAAAAGGSRDGSGGGATASVSKFTTMTYSGILLAPPAIGWCAEAFGLEATLAALVPALVAVAALARAATATPGTAVSRP
jgi:MFS family permease